MPKILDQAVKEIRKKGASKSAAFAIATSTLQKAGELKAGTRTATTKGTKRGNMSKSERHAKPV